MESSFMVTRKHDDICGVGVPAANIVGDACVKYRSDIYKSVEGQGMVSNSTIYFG